MKISKQEHASGRQVSSYRSYKGPSVVGWLIAACPYNASKINFAKSIYCTHVEHSAKLRGLQLLMIGRKIRRITQDQRVWYILEERRITVFI